MKFKIINGFVYDPTQNLNREKKNIYVKDDKIVEPKSNEIKDYKHTFDAKDMIVMAGGIDIHSHIAGGNVNNARLLMPEIHRRFVEKFVNFSKKNDVFTNPCIQMLSKICGTGAPNEEKLEVFESA